jgi:hypothetical protein
VNWIGGFGVALLTGALGLVLAAVIASACVDW